MTVKTSPRLPFNGDVLHWAREWRGKTLEEAAQKLRTKKDKISSWEKGESVPTARQARMLADFYERGFLEFFLPEPPELNESELVPDYRLDRNATPHDDRELWHIQRWAETQHLNAIDLYDMLEESPPVIPPELKATLKTDPERIAKKVRQVANFPIQRQLDLTGNDRQSLPKLIRAAFESIGVLVLRGKGLSKHSVRDISIAKFPLPTIVFGNEAITAQPFTLAHELGHILLHQSGISGPPSARDSNTPEKAVERWCDKFAAAFLIPLDELERHLEKTESADAGNGRRNAKSTGNDIPDKQACNADPSRKCEICRAWILLECDEAKIPRKGSRASYGWRQAQVLRNPPHKCPRQSLHRASPGSVEPRNHHH